MNEPIKKINYLLYILACITICIFLISIFIYDRATDTHKSVCWQQRLLHFGEQNKKQGYCQ